MKHAPSVSPAADRAVAEVVRLRAENARLVASNKELARLCEKALTRSAIVHPGFADEIRAALEPKP